MDQKSQAVQKQNPIFIEYYKLSDEYTVIHSIPWLSSAIKELYNDRSNIGEVDFLVIHPVLGVLAIEVKGGQFNRDSSGYYYSQGESRSHFDPHEQLNRGVFALQKLLKDKGIRTRFGKAYYFPRTNFGMNVPPEYIDHCNGKSLRIIIDESNDGKEASIIENLMQHYKALLGIKPLGEAGVKQIQECLYPTSNHGPCWVSRISNDKAWLKLTHDQNYCVNQAIDASRYIVTGWPGSGKTLVLIQTCRELAKQGKKTLVFTFHNPLANKIKAELKGVPNCDVLSFYQLCCSYGDNDDYYKSYRNVETLKQIVEDNKLSEFDTLLIDEGQAISEEAWQLFIQPFVQKQIIVMCDDTQVFKNEASVSLNFLSTLLGVTPFTLTESLRMPKAVCDELYLFNSPSYSVINNRPKDKDALNRVVTHDQETMLKQAIARLLSDGINKSDICVLKPNYVIVPSELVPSGVMIENISEFRGLEKPIVIIFTSQDISNTEFFCAYSRATSRCIILFDANFIEKGMYDKLGKGLFSSDPDKVRSIANKGLIHNRLTEEYHLTRETIFSGEIELEWIPKWKSYIVYSAQNLVLQALIASYIELHNISALISWSPWSKKT